MAKKTETKPAPKATAKGKTETKTVYKGVNMDKVRRYSMPKRSGGSSDWFTMKDKKWDNEPTVIRMLPPIGGMNTEGLPWTEHYLHYADSRFGSFRMFKQAGKEYDFGITCLQAHLGVECPVCKLAEWAEDQEDADLAEGLAPTTKFYVNIILREEDKLYSWNASPGTIKRCVEFFKGKVGDFTHPEKGRDLIIMKQVTGGRTRYSCDYDPDLSPIAFPGWEDAKDHTKSIVILKPEEIIEILAGNMGAQAPIHTIFGLKKGGKR